MFYWKRGVILGISVLLSSAVAYGQEISKEQMQSLDEQVQEIKSDVLGIAAELSQLEEKLLYPSNTQVAVFVSLAEGETFRLDSVQIQIDGAARRASHLQLQGAGGPAEGRRAADLHRQRRHRRAPTSRSRRREAAGRRGLQRNAELQLPQGRRAEARRDHAGRRGSAMPASSSEAGSSRGRAPGLARIASASAALLPAVPAAGGDLKDLYFGEALYYAYQEHYFEALERLDAEIAQHYRVDEPRARLAPHHIENAEFSVGDFELHYRMHHRAGRAIKAVLEGDVEEPVRNEAAFRLARIHFQKDQPQDALHALERIQRRGPRGDPRRHRVPARERLHGARPAVRRRRRARSELQGSKSLTGFSAYNLGIALLQDGRRARGRRAARPGRAGQQR